MSIPLSEILPHLPGDLRALLAILAAPLPAGSSVSVLAGSVLVEWPGGELSIEGAKLKASGPAARPMTAPPALSPAPAPRRRGKGGA